MTPSDLDEIRKRCEGPGCVECGTPDSVTDDAKALLDEVERLQRLLADVDVDVFVRVTAEREQLERQLRTWKANHDQRKAERDALRARLALLEPVWEAAKEWRETDRYYQHGKPFDAPSSKTRTETDLASAIDAAVAKEGR